MEPKTIVAIVLVAFIIGGFIRRNIPKRAIGCMTIQLWSACSKYCCSVSLNSLSKRFSPFFKVRTLIGIGH